jgi:hypothetical protein
MDSGQKGNEEVDLERGPHFAEIDDPEKLKAWEEIDIGRYMPRRIRGSNRGRALG